MIRRRNIEGTSDVEFRDQLTSVLTELSEEDLGKVEALLRTVADASSEGFSISPYQLWTNSPIGSVVMPQALEFGDESLAGQLI